MILYLFFDIKFIQLVTKTRLMSAVRHRARSQTTNVVSLHVTLMCSRRKPQQRSTRKFLLFNVVTQWTLSEKLYQRAAVDFPMMIRHVVINVGSTSYDMQRAYIEMNNSTADDHGDTSASPASSRTEKTRQEEPLATYVNRIVNVDIVTRKAAPLPDDLVQDLNLLVGEVANDCRISPSVRLPIAAAGKTFRCRVTVRFDDTDFQGHTNTSSYLMYALECAAQAANSGFYSAIRDDVAFYRPKKVTNVFVSESNAGDELNISTWEDENNQLLLNFAISNKGRHISHSQIEFFNNETFK